jgi:hypothetical protein
MTLPPRGKCHRLPIRQEIDDASLLGVDEDRAKRTSFAKRPLVDSEHARGGRGGQGEGANAGQQGIGTRREPEGGEQPCAGLAAQSESHRRKPGRKPVGSPSMPSMPSIGSKYPWETLSENGLWAVRCGAEKAAHMQFQPQRNAVPGEVGRTAHIPRLDALGAASTRWTARIQRPCTHAGDTGLALRA